MTPLASVCSRSSGVVMPLLPSSWTYFCSHSETVEPVATIWYWATLTMA